MTKAKLTKRAVDALKPEAEDVLVWCGETHGFGVRVYPSGRKVFFVQYRVHGKSRRMKIGPFGTFTVEQARERAEDAIRKAGDGIDALQERRNARTASTVAELCQEYLDAADAGLIITRFKTSKRASTVAIDHGRVSRHIVPLIGGVRVKDLTRQDVQRMADKIASGKTAGTFKGKLRGKSVVRGGAGTAARVVELLGGICNWAGLNPNPVEGVKTIRGTAKDRVLTPDELSQLGAILCAHKSALPSAVAAVKLIALTGLRRQEACSLKWSEVDEAGSCLRLQSTKTGRSVRPVGKAVFTILNDLPRTSGFVFPGSKEGVAADLKRSISTLFDKAGLSDARSHDLRRTFATTAANLDLSDATIGELLGHARRGVTARHYIRRPDDALVAAANRVSALVQKQLNGEKIAAVLPFTQIESRSTETA